MIGLTYGLQVSYSWFSCVTFAQRAQGDHVHYQAGVHARRVDGGLHSIVCRLVLPASFCSDLYVRYPIYSFFLPVYSFWCMADLVTVILVL